MSPFGLLFASVVVHMSLVVVVRCGCGDVMSVAGRFVCGRVLVIVVIVVAGDRIIGFVVAVVCCLCCTLLFCGLPCCIWWVRSLFLFGTLVLPLLFRWFGCRNNCLHMFVSQFVIA